MTTPAGHLGLFCDLHTDPAAELFVLGVAGELDASDVAHFRAAAAPVGSDARLVLDLSEVAFVDSAGLGALVGIIRRLNDGGGQVAIVATPRLLRLLHTVGIDNLALLAANLTEAQDGLIAGRASVHDSRSG